MNNNIKLLFCLCVFPWMTYAQELKKSSFFGDIKPYGYIKTGFEQYAYKEPGVMSVSGPMYSVAGMVGMKLNSFLKTDAEIYYAVDVGKNIYDGSLQEITSSGAVVTTPFSARSSDYYVGGVYRVGVSVLADERDEFFGLYLGLGYRYLKNNIHSRYAYLREQSYLYLPIGARVKVRVSNKVRLKFDGEVRALLLGSNTSHFKDIGDDNNLHFTQSSGSGLRLALGAEFFITKRNILFIQGIFDYWNIGKSNTATAYKDGSPAGNYIEPQNSTIAYGLEIGYAF